MKKERKTIFLSGENEVYRIPALFYNRDEKTLIAFAEKRKTEDDSSTEALVMKTAKVKNEENHEVTIEWSEQKTLIEKCPLGYRPMNLCPLYEKTNKTLFLFLSV
ncbi:hypothetical protein NQZ68_034473 [Dissostichus eleginoides]|nr:hypothetical protein NQZ68_034473 [Dissostichus eleginoides]